MSSQRRTVPLFAAVLFAVDSLLENLADSADRWAVRMDTAVSDRPKALREQRGKLEKQIDDLINKAEGENRDLNAEEKVQYEKLFAESKTLRDRIKRLEDRDGTLGDEAERRDRRDRARGSDDGRISEDTYNLALAGWMLNQFTAWRGDISDKHRESASKVGLSLDDQEFAIKLLKGKQAKRLKEAYDCKQNIYDALSSEVASDGGVLRPTELLTSLEIAMLQYGGMMEEAQVIRTSNANPLLWPTVNDTGNTGRQVGESKPVTNATNPTFATQRWGAWKITSDEILASYEILRDAEVVDLGSLIGELLGERIGRFINTRCTIGNGGNTIRGIVPRSTLGLTAASQTALADTELVRMVHKIDPALRGPRDCKWMMHDDTVMTVRLIKDGNGQFIWRPGLDAGAPDTLLTYPIRVNQDMPTIASGTKPILFGQLKKYKIRQVNQIRLYRLTERHRENDQDAFLAFTELDGDLLDPTNGGANAPVKHLLMA